MKIYFTHHALEQIKERGTDQEEVKEALLRGERIPAKKGRHAYRLNFQYDRIWSSKHYAIKQVMPVVTFEEEVTVVITVYVFYF